MARNSGGSVGYGLGERSGSRSAGRRNAGRSFTALVLVAAIASLLVGCRNDGRDVGVSVEGAPTWLAPGEARAFTVTVTNHGTAPATTSEANLLAELVLDPSGTGPQGACDEATGHGSVFVSCPLGTLDPGESASATFIVTGAASVGSHEITVSAASDKLDPDPDPTPDAVQLPIQVGTGGEVDLHVSATRQPARSGANEPYDSRTVLANRGPSAASQVVVEQRFPTSVPVVAATLRRSDGGAEGSCTIGAGVVTCSTGSALVEPLDHPDDQWFLDATLVPPDIHSFGVTHEATSPHPETDPDEWPDTVTSTQYVSYLGYLAFEPVAPVPVGDEVEVHGTWVGSSFHYAQFVSVSLPVGFEIVQVLASGQATTCGIAAPSNQCTAQLLYLDGSTITIRARAVAATAPGQGGATFSSEAGGANGTFPIQAVDPARTSEIHPELTAPVDGVVGQVTTVTGVARNTGSTPHEGVTVHVSTPGADLAFARWGSVQIPCATTAGTATCAVGTVDAYDAVPIEIGVVGEAPGTQEVEVTVTSGTAQMDPDPVADSQSVSFPMLAATVDLGMSLLMQPDTPTMGTPQLLRAYVTNHGTITSPAATLTVTVPESLPVTDATAVAFLSPGGAPCATADQVVTCPLGNLARGRTQEVRITTSVPTDVGGVVAFELSSAAAEPTPDPHPNHVEQPIVVSAPAADLTGSLKTWPTYVSGEAYEMEGRAFNYGPSAVTDATATVSLPSDWSVTSAVTASGTPCSFVPGTVSCPIGALHPSGGNLRFYIEGVVGAVADDASASITVASSLPDPGPLPATVSYPFDVLPQEVDLGLDSSTPTEVEAGADEVVSIRITNAGPATATNAVVTATFPSDVEVVSARTSNPSGIVCTITGQVVACTFPNVYPTSDPMYSPRANITVRHLTFGSPSSYQVTVTSDQPERADQTLPNSLTIDRTPVPGDAVLRVWGRDQLGNPRLVTVRAYRPTDGLAPSYTATAWVSDGWASLTLAHGYEYRLAISSDGCTTTWWEGAAGRSTATPMVAAGLSEVWDLHAVLSCP